MLSAEQRLERKRSIQLHMRLLEHSSKCVSCPSKNCKKMKEFIAHDRNCEFKHYGECRLCNRFSNLLNFHARACKVDACRVVSCRYLISQIRIREQFEILNDIQRCSREKKSKDNDDANDDNDNNDAFLFKKRKKEESK